MPDAEWIAASPYPATWAADKSTWRSHGTVRRIMDDPTDIVIRRGNTYLDSQTVRIENRSGSVNPDGSRAVGNQTTFVRMMTVFGIKDHPTLPDLDIATGDRFGAFGDNFVVMSVTPYAGEIQALVQRVQG